MIGANNITEHLVDWYSKYNHEITIIEKKINIRLSLMFE